MHCFQPLFHITAASLRLLLVHGKLDGQRLITKGSHMWAKNISEKGKKYPSVKASHKCVPDKAEQKSKCVSGTHSITLQFVLL